ncbi:MAG: SGNH/GDSL hydrolase family protein, partial [Acidobacteriota bacterium]
GPKVLPDKPGMTEMRPMIEKYNDWVRTSGTFDAVVDFYKVLRDPENPQVMRAEFDSGDHTHPSDKGYQAMADAIDLRELAK